MKRHFNHILNSAINSKYISEKSLSWFGSNEEYLEYIEALSFLCEHGVLKNIGGHKYMITSLGRKVYRGIGIDKYLEKSIKKQERLEQKEKFDFQISKFQANSKYLPHIFSTLGLIISIIALTKSQKEVPTEKQLSKSELIRIIDSISISNQTKKVDSTHISKTLNSPLN